MTSAEKKPAEPSMDDIISSIRNIIADDDQQSVAVPQNVVEETVEEPAPPVVQLTENQIFEPVAPMEQAPIPVTPAPNETQMPAAVNAEIASEFDAVPGVNDFAPQDPVSSPAPQASVTQTPIAQAPIAEAPIAQAPEMQQAPIASAPASQVAEAGLAVAPETPTPAPIAEQMAPVAPAIPPAVQNTMPAPEVVPANDVATPDYLVPAISEADNEGMDPVEEMMQIADDPEGLDLVNPEVDPDKILEGMEAGPAGPAGTEPLRAETAAPVPMALEPEVVLDASQVTPEEAAALSAVAMATSEALAGDAAAEAETKPECGNSLEDSIKSMMKPMIREWLDDNMPRILESAVKEEVDKSDGNDG